MSRPPKTAHLNMPPHVYVTVWEDLHNSAQKYMQRKKAGLLFWLYCCCSRRRRVLETLCVIVKEKLLCLGSKRGHNYKSVVKLYLQHCSRTLQPKYCVCSAICAGLCPEPGRVSYNASVLKDFL